MLGRFFASCVLAAAVCAPANADMYHGAGANVQKIEDWEAAGARDLGLQRVTGTDNGVRKGELRAGDLRDAKKGSAIGDYRRLPGALVGQVSESRIKVLTDAIAFLAMENVKQTEYPQLDAKLIADVRKSAMKLLAAAGKPAVEHIIQDLLTDPPIPSGSDGIKIVASHHQDLLKTLEDMADAGGDDRVTIDDVKGWVATVTKSQLKDTERSQVRRAVWALLALDTLAAAIEKPAEHKVSKDELLKVLKDRLRDLIKNDPDGYFAFEKAHPALQKQLGDLRGELRRKLAECIRDDPDSFVQLRDEHASLETLCAEILAQTDCQTLKRAYDKTKSMGAIRLLLEKPDGFSVLRLKDLQDPAIQNALRGLVEKPGYRPQAAAAVVRGVHNPDEAGLKRLLAEGKPWERLGAFWLGLETLGRSKEGLDVLVDALARIPDEYRATMGARLADRIGDASTNTLLKALKLGDESLLTRVAALLAEHASQPEARATLRQSEREIVAAFSKQRAKLVALPRVLAAIRTRVALGALIDGLTDPSADVWQSCRDQLAGVNPVGTKLGPLNNATEAERAKSQTQWREWLSTYKEP